MNNKPKTSSKRPDDKKVVRSNINVEKVIRKRLDNETFINNLLICGKIYDYRDESKHVEEKKQRVKALTYIQKMFNDDHLVEKFVQPNVEPLMEMVEKNIFRPLEPVQNCADPDAEAEQDMENEVSWNNLEGVYIIFLQLVLHQSTDPEVLKKYINKQFMGRFMELLNSENSYERDYLKNILHKLYSKLVARRKMIRKAMNDQFLNLIHESYKFNGASELLDIQASITSGFATPLRDEHISMFNNIMMPLHKVQTCTAYFEQLFRCSMIFVTKDRSLAGPLIENLIKFWPFANAEKEQMFLTELLEVIEYADHDLIEGLIPKLFKRIVKCISCDHLKTTDNTMIFFENKYFLNLLKKYKEVTFPILAPVIADLAKNHWHSTLRECLEELQKILIDMDSAAFDAALNSSQTLQKFKIKQTETERSELDKKWANLNSKLKIKDETYEEPVVPFQNELVLKEYNSVYSQVYNKVKLI